MALAYSSPGEKVQMGESMTAASAGGGVLRAKRRRWLHSTGRDTSLDKAAGGFLALQVLIFPGKPAFVSW